jgi:hypothetical protein
MADVSSPSVPERPARRPVTDPLRSRCDDRGVIRGFRERIGAEEGMISASTVILIAIGAFVVYLLLAAFQGDTAQFGAVPVPGKATVELPEGDVDVYYAEKVDPDAGVPLITPDDLQYTVTGPGGEGIPVSSRGDDAKSTGDGMTRLIGQIKAPEDGDYVVTTESTQAGQRISPELTFGQGPFAAVGQRFSDVVDALRGPVGIIVLAILVLLFLLPRWKLARRRQSYKGKT